MPDARGQEAPLRSWPWPERIAVRLLMWSVRRRSHPDRTIRLKLTIEETTQND